MEVMDKCNRGDKGYKCYKEDNTYYLNRGWLTGSK